MKKKTFMIVWFFIFAMAIVSGTVYMHEVAHREIAVKHGCVDYEFDFLSFTPSFTCNMYEDRERDVVLQELELHSLNEVKSYNDGPIIMTLLILLALVFERNWK